MEEIIASLVLILAGLISFISKDDKQSARGAILILAGMYFLTGKNINIENELTLAILFTMIIVPGTIKALIVFLKGRKENI